jgi:hypothetical protein
MALPKETLNTLVRKRKNVTLAMDLGSDMYMETLKHSVTAKVTAKSANLFSNSINCTTAKSKHIAAMKMDILNTLAFFFHNSLPVARSVVSPALSAASAPLSSVTIFFSGSQPASEVYKACPLNGTAIQNREL